MSPFDTSNSLLFGLAGFNVKARPSRHHLFQLTCSFTHFQGGHTMTTITLRSGFLMLCLMAFTGLAYGQDAIHEHLAETVTEAKAADSPAEKRAILNKGLQSLSKALADVHSSPMISDEDRAGIERLAGTIYDKIDELNGLNGFEPVADADLDDFADYMMQDIEQAQRITLSLVALLLIILIVILITR
jgi:hypothetical protein